MEKQTKSRKSSTASSGNTQKTNKARSTASTPMQMDEMLEQLFTDQLQDIYYAEKLLTKALPKMSKAASTEELQQAIDNHLAQTEEQVTRLEKVFEMLGKKAQAKKCDGMDGLQKEAETIIEETEEGSLTRDVGIIMAAQKVEHYEIATYGGLAQLADTFGMTEVAELLHQTLEEEKEADNLLTQVAEGINFPAGLENEEGEMEEDEDEEK